MIDRPQLTLKSTHGQTFRTTPGHAAHPLACPRRRPAAVRCERVQGAGGVDAGIGSWEDSDEDYYGESIEGPTDLNSALKRAKEKVAKRKEEIGA